MGQKEYDVLIVGGGVMGSSIAYHLLDDGLDGTVAVLEKDPAYEFASTPRSMGGIRQQFSTEINIRIGLYGVEVIERFDEEMAVDGEPAHADFHPRGYLFLADGNNWETLRKQYRLQRSLGVDVALLTPEEVKDMLPHVNVEGLLGASFGRRAGYLDAYGLLACSQETRHGTLHRPGTGRGEHQNRLVRLEDVLQSFLGTGQDGLELRRSMVDAGPGHAQQHGGRNFRRPRRHQSTLAHAFTSRVPS